MELMLVGHNFPDELIAQFAVVDRETLSNKGVLTFRARLNEVSVSAVRDALDNLEAQAEEALAAAYPVTSIAGSTPPLPSPNLGEGVNGGASSAPTEGKE